jgi:hypothetical protein
MGPGTEGVWLPVALNECFKFARYRPGAHTRASDTTTRSWS